MIKNKNKFLSVAMLGFCMTIPSMAFSQANIDNETFQGVNPNTDVMVLDIEQMSGQFTKSNQIAKAFNLGVNAQNTQWVQNANGQWVWQYNINVPNAENLTFRMQGVAFPAGVVLNVYDENKKLVISYDQEKLNKFSSSEGKMLTPVMKGESAYVELVANNEGEVANTKLTISKLFVGGKNPMAKDSNVLSEEDVVQDDGLKAQKWLGSMKSFSNSEAVVGSASEDFVSCAAETATGSGDFETIIETGPNSELDLGSCEGDYTAQCREQRLRKYGCFFEQENYDASRSTVGLLIDNGDDFLSVCSGTLVNNTSNDGSNYVLTAAHCADDDANLYSADYNPLITAYFNTESVCGTAKRFFYNVDAADMVANYTTATAVVNVDNPNGGNTPVNADAWLLVSSDEVPEGANPYWLGVNATAPSAAAGNNEPTFTSAINISYPSGYGKHFAKTNNINVGRNVISSTFDEAASWITYTSFSENIGSVIPGSSGSPLIDQNMQQRGILSAIGPQSGRDLFARLDLAWNPMLNGEPLENSQGSRAQGLAAFLAANDTTQTVIAGRADPEFVSLDVNLSPSDGTNLDVGDQVELSYFIHDASSCIMNSIPDNTSWDGAFTVQNDTRQTTTVSIENTGTTAFNLQCTSGDGDTLDKTVYLSTESTIDRNVSEDDDVTPPNNNGGGSDNDDDGGSSGGGCTMATDAPFDPMFLVLLGLASLVLFRKKSLKS